MSIIKFEDRKDRIVFFVGCFSTFYVSILGRVYVGELIIFLLYLFKSSIRGVQMPPYLKKINKLLWLWLFSAIGTDIIRHTPTIDVIKGAVSILFLIALLPFVYWALRDKVERWYYFVIGTIISSQLTYYFLTATTEFGSQEIWKVYSFVPLFTGLAGWLFMKGRTYWSYLVFILFGLWTLYNGSRNVFLTCSITVVVLYYISKCKSGDLLKDISIYRRRIGGLFLSLILALFAIDFSYAYLASNGYLGSKAYEKYMTQSNSKHGIASGRLEAIMAATLISESPIVGYGSYAKDHTNFVYNFYRKNGYEIKPGRFDFDENSIENMLPRHSRIFGLWMWHGIGSGIFWIFILFLFYKVLKNGCLLLYPHLIGFSIFTLFTEIFDTLFSPMSVRLVPLFFWVFLLMVFNKYKTLTYAK